MCIRDRLYTRYSLILVYLVHSITCVQERASCPGKSGKCKVSTRIPHTYKYIPTWYTIRTTKYLVLCTRTYMQYAGSSLRYLRASSSTKPQIRQPRIQCRNSNVTFCILLSSKLSHINARPPARNQEVQRGPSPRGCTPSSNPTLASVPSGQLPSQLVAMSSSQRQPHETRDKHVVYIEATTCVRTHHVQKCANATPIIHHIHRI